VGGHLFRGVIPDLPVVGEEITLGDPLSERCINPVLEGFHRREFPFLRCDQGFYVFMEAEIEVLFRECRKAVLEGVLHKPVLVENPGIPLPDRPVPFKDREHEPENFLIP